MIGDRNKLNQHTMFSLQMSALVLLANGVEEMEAVITIDILRRASINVTTASFNSPTLCSRKVIIVPDMLVQDLKLDYDMLVLPGGLEAARTFEKSDLVKDLLNKYLETGKYVGIICASPIALKNTNAKGMRITSHPSVRDQLVGFDYCEDDVVIDGKLITSRGPGTAFKFALKLAELLAGTQVVEAIKKAMIYH